MRIAIGSDHIGLDLKGTIIAALETDGHVLLDLGAFSLEPVDYPDCARIVGQAVLGGFVDCGMLVCHTAVGAAIAANKMRGIRGAPCLDPATARESRERQDANVLCLSAAGLRDHAAIDIARAWVSARFSGDDASARQVAKLAQLEAGLGPAKDAARPVPRAGATDLTPSDAEPKPAVAAAADGEPKPAVVAPSPALASTAPAIAADVANPERRL